MHAERIGRREFLRLGAQTGVGLAAAFLVGCNKAENQSATNSGVELNQDTVERVSRFAIEDFNRILATNLDIEKTTAQIKLVSSLDEYQQIIGANEQGYIPKDEITRPAITTDQTPQSPKSIYLYNSALTITLSQIPENFREIALNEFIEMVIKHELVHFSSAQYPSPALHDVTYGKIVKNIPEFAGKEIIAGVVEGAEVKATVAGQKKSLFQNLEEAEAFLIGDLAIRKRGQLPYIEPLTAGDLGIEVQAQLTRDLLTKLNPDLDESLKNLFSLRNKVGGREEYCLQIANSLSGKVRPGEELFFANSVLFLVDVGDAQNYRALTS